MFADVQARFCQLLHIHDVKTILIHFRLPETIFEHVKTVCEMQYNLTLSTLAKSHILFRLQSFSTLNVAWIMCCLQRCVLAGSGLQDSELEAWCWPTLPCLRLDFETILFRSTLLQTLVGDSFLFCILENSRISLKKLRHNMA